MKLLFTLSIFILTTTVSRAETIKLSGKIGDYSIEMEISKYKPEEGVFYGRYRYIGKENYLDLAGMTFGNCLQITESYREKETGEFFLTIEGDQLTGKWMNPDKWYEVSLNVESGDISRIMPKELHEYAALTNDSISGSYGNESYFINDMWFDEENHPLEIGFNGGYAVIEELSSDSIAFQVEVICGPTYHFAFAAGIAYRNGEVYEYIYSDECTITFQFGEKQVDIEANASFECGFGARAYLEHSFIKVNDGVAFGENLSLSDLKRITPIPDQEKK